MVWNCTLDQGHRNKKHHIEGRTFQKVRISVTGDLTTLEAIYSAYLYIDSLGKITTKVCKNTNSTTHGQQTSIKTWVLDRFVFFTFLLHLGVLQLKAGDDDPHPCGDFLPTSLDQEFIVLNQKNIENADDYTVSTS